MTRNLAFTGERIVPGKTPEPVLREHEARYLFAGKLVKGKAVLDVACGTGIGTHYLLRAGARSCLGLDIDGPAVEFAKSTYQGCQFELGDATSLRIPDNSIEAVVSFETIEHLREQRKFLLECNRVLQPGGLLICSTPNRTMNGWKNPNPYHVREFTAAEFAGFLEDIFTDVHLYSQNREIYWLRLVKTMLAGILERLRVRSAVKRMLVGKPTLPARTQFDEQGRNWESEIRPYLAAWNVQPRYILAVARRRLR